MSDQETNPYPLVETRKVLICLDEKPSHRRSKYGKRLTLELSVEVTGIQSKRHTSAARATVNPVDFEPEFCACEGRA